MPCGVRGAGAARLAERIRMGWLTPAPNPTRLPPPRLPIAPLAHLVRELNEDRQDR